MSKKGSLVIISGFSGAGKGTVVKELMKNYDCYALSISATTRNPRPGEEMVGSISLRPRKNLKN